VGLSFDLKVLARFVGLLRICGYASLQCTASNLSPHAFLPQCSPLLTNNNHHFLSSCDFVSIFIPDTVSDRA
jgi:hypothetical protein